MVSGVDEKLKEVLAFYDAPKFGLQFIDKSDIVSMNFSHKIQNNIAILISILPVSKMGTHYRVILSTIKLLLQLSENTQVYLFITGNHNGSYKRPTTDFMTNKIFLSALNQTLLPAEVLRLNIIASTENSFDKSYTTILKVLKEKSIGTVLMARDNLQIPYLDSILSLEYNIIDLIFNNQNMFSGYSKGVLSHLDTTRNLGGRYYYKFKMNPVLNDDEIIFFKNEYAIQRYKKSTFSNSKIKLVSAITGNRISRGLIYSKEDIKYYLKTIEEFDCEWHIIGEKYNNLIGISDELDRLILLEKVIVIDAIENLQSYLNKCDIYVQPLGVTGGGGSAGINAVLSGLPIVLFNRADCESLIVKHQKLLTYKSGLIYLKKLLNEVKYREIVALDNYQLLKESMNNKNTSDVESFLSLLFSKESNYQLEDVDNEK